MKPKTREERIKLVDTAIGLASTEGHSANKDIFKPYIEGEKTLEEILEEEMKKIIDCKKSQHGSFYILERRKRKWTKNMIN